MDLYETQLLEDSCLSEWVLSFSHWLYLTHPDWLEAINCVCPTASERSWASPALGQADKQRSEQDAWGLMVQGDTNNSLTFAGGPPQPGIRIPDTADCSSIRYV